MKIDIQDALLHLRKQRWRADMAAECTPLPAIILKRYPWLPAEWTDFLAAVKDLSNAEETVWVLSSSDYQADTDAAFPWNAWERLCLECAAQEQDEEWAERIRCFWNENFPVVLSVGSGYAYYALRKADLKVVHGMEPDFEDTSIFADSLAEMLGKLPGEP